MMAREEEGERRDGSMNVKVTKVKKMREESVGRVQGRLNDGKRGG